MERLLHIDLRDTIEFCRPPLLTTISVRVMKQRCPTLINSEMRPQPLLSRVLVYGTRLLGPSGSCSISSLSRCPAVPPRFKGNTRHLVKTVDTVMLCLTNTHTATKHTPGSANMEAINRTPVEYQYKYAQKHGILCRLTRERSWWWLGVRRSGLGPVL